ncbi:hypothetical protein [Bradyrhizobium sp. MOS002]|uniref:hypothetical protein n=1 Tax=Bradyrhizobium sp. MOS002 TaxID=2133947 RepID=UPI000D40B741|nr:hypothetical protein [Bradyrhizobium sp. MOS002]PSO23657.1 hypothetical protein C7G41_32490 [Bradyrhizobium sp. MOS002]
MLEPDDADETSAEALGSAVDAVDVDVLGEDELDDVDPEVGSVVDPAALVPLDGGGEVCPELLPPALPVSVPTAELVPVPAEADPSDPVAWEDPVEPEVFELSAGSDCCPANSTKAKIVVVVPV